MIAVQVVDQERLARAGVCSILRNSESINVVGEAGDGKGALELARRLKPDVVVVDVRLPGLDGIRLTQVLAAELPKTKVIVFTDLIGEECIHRSLRAGAAGFLSKQADPTELVGAVRSVHAGRLMFSPEVTCHIVEQFKKINRDRTRRARDKINALTQREQEVIELVSFGLGNARIAKTLYMSEGAVKAHISHMLAKLGCQNRVQAAILAHDSGMFAQDWGRLEYENAS